MSCYLYLVYDGGGKDDVGDNDDNLPIHVKASLDGSTTLSPKPKANPTPTPINTLIIRLFRDKKS